MRRRKAEEATLQNELTQRRWTPPRTPLTVLSLLVIGLNAFDAFATLRACRTMGAVELNPIMSALLAIGPGAFVAAKTLWIVAAMVVLSWSLHHPRVRDRMRKFGWGGLIAISAVYALLCAWHLLIMYGAITPPETGSTPFQSPACGMTKNRPR